MPKPPAPAAPPPVPVVAEPAVVAAPVVAPPAVPATRSGARSPLPPVEGVIAADVQAYLGMPNSVLQGPAGSLAWHYPTPSGRQTVYIVGGLATMTAPSRAGSAPPSPRDLVTLGACDGVRAAAGVKAVAVVNQDSPVFIEPKFRQQALTLLPIKKTADVLSDEGAWFLIRFNDERWGPRQGFIHCSDVTAQDKR
jgi:hypothetical protein